MYDKYYKHSKKSNSSELNASKKKLRQLCEIFDLVDIWRKQNTSQKRYTWSQPNPLTRCRLDYFLISNHLINSKVGSRILPSIKTDHALIELTFKLNGPKRGPGIWKLNTSFLEDNKYKDEIKNIIDTEWKKLESHQDLALRFDWVKHKIREYSIKYGKLKAKLNREKENNLLDTLSVLDKKICEETITDRELKSYEENKKKSRNLRRV